jgi:hypothetical protein
LPDRKNRLASLQALTENLHPLFLHLYGRHVMAPCFLDTQVPFLGVL